MEKRIQSIINVLEEKNLKHPQNMELFDDETELRDLQTIARRAIISAIMSKCAFDLYEAEKPDKIKADCLTALKKFGVENFLFDAEQKVLTEEFDESLCDTIGWRYEAANALLWSLGFTDDIINADYPDDIELAINKTFAVVNSYNDFGDFIMSCKLKNEAELQDAYQLYWYYLWNIRDGMIFGNLPESIFYDIVLERRRALEWLIYSMETDEKDWEFGMDT